MRLGLSGRLRRIDPIPFAAAERQLYERSCASVQPRCNAGGCPHRCARASIGRRVYRPGPACLPCHAHPVADLSNASFSADHYLFPYGMHPCVHALPEQLAYSVSRRQV